MHAAAPSQSERPQDAYASALGCGLLNKIGPTTSAPSCPYSSKNAGRCSWRRDVAFLSWQALRCRSARAHSAEFLALASFDSQDDEEADFRRGEPRRQFAGRIAAL
mmetsp:Transcript_164751/g.528574  ORF Transcript_164751/g.528574 Transcript_164751/m.528574 type:complete len:106 (+) Transcript_164751:686-1003(+)